MRLMGLWSAIGTIADLLPAYLEGVVLLCVWAWLDIEVCNHFTYLTVI